MLIDIIEQKGHGIPDSLIKEVREITHKYFGQPYEEKLKIKLSDKTGYRFLQIKSTSSLNSIY